MQINSPLKLSNQEFVLSEGVFHPSTDEYAESAYSPAVIQCIRDIYRKSKTLKMFSLIEHSDDDFTGSMTSDDKDRVVNLLTPSYYNFLLNLNASHLNGVLDLTEDVGGVSSYLAKGANFIDSVKRDRGLSELASDRTASFPNVTHFSADITKINLPSDSYDLIIIGQLESLDLDLVELDKLIERLHNALTERGVLIVNAQNSNRASKLLNEENKNKPFAASYQSVNHKQELSLTELRTTLLNHSFGKVAMYASFSPLKYVNNLFSEDYLTSSVHFINHFYDLGYFDDPRRSEFLSFNRMKQDRERLIEKSSRFIAIAGRSNQVVRNMIDCDFAHYPNPQSPLAAMLITQRTRSSQFVERLNYLDNPNLVSKTAYIKGSLLSTQWLSLIANEGIEEFKQIFNEYRQWIVSLEKPKFEILSQKLLSSQIIVHARNKEYVATNNGVDNGESLDINNVLFRSLFWFCMENKAVFESFAKENDIDSISGFIKRCIGDIATSKALEDFIKAEQSLHDSQNKVGRRISVANEIDALVGDKLSSHPLNRADRSTLLFEALERKDDSIAFANAEIRSNKQLIEELKVQRADLSRHLKSLERQVATERNVQGNLYAQIEHLQARLHARRIENEEIRHFLLMRPSTRIKTFMRRWIDRLKGKPFVDETDQMDDDSIINENPYTEDEQEPPFDQLPEGKLIGMNTEDYEQWITENTPTTDDIEKIKKEIEQMPYKPVFSILVPIYNTDPEYLLPMIDSVRNQVYPYWQLCLVDDCSPNTYLKAILKQQSIDDDRIVIKLNDVNQGISITTNDALSIATGDYIALLDHDDEITIDALYENAKLINQQPDAELIYSDEDKMELDGTRLEPYFKPDYSPDLLDTNNYVCHFTVMKKSIMEEIGGFREGLDGSQDHDVILRAANTAKAVAHIPKILYHWRKIPGSTAVEYDSKGYAWEAGRKAIENLHRSYDDSVRVEFGQLKGSYRVIREIIGNPLVSIVIPFKDKPNLLDSCLTSILERSSYKNFEVIGVSNNSEEPLTAERIAHFSELDNRIKFIEHNVPFNFSDICNKGVTVAAGEYIVLLNNDIEIQSPDWIERMLEHAQRDHIGAVGSKLIFPDGRIQHAGVVAGMVGAAGHPHKFFPEEHIGYNGRLHMVSNVSAVTGAMLMVAKSKYLEVGGLDSKELAIAYNDIDFCLKLLNAGYLNVFTPYARAIHHESVSRGYEDTDEKMQRLLKEQASFLERWKDFLTKGDPFYNPNMSLKNERFSFRFKE
ncbi:MAG: glycosyltransferase [Gammaproteobacteria bacterium]|nr:glycosyltransferase [Gammaproteobacteria bacterium]